MSRGRPEAGCLDLTFRARYRIDDSAEVALEDYARALTRASAAEAVHDEGDVAAVRGVHLCGLESPVPHALQSDLDDFASTLAAPAPGGLGWS